MTSLYPLVPRRRRLLRPSCRRRRPRWPRSSARPATRRSRCRRSSSPASSRTCTRASRSCTRTARCPTRDRARPRASTSTAAALARARIATCRSSSSSTSSIRTIPTSRAGPTTRMWADPGAQGRARAAGRRRSRKVIEDPLLRLFGMPTRDELEKAGFDPDAYVEHDRGLVRRLDPRHGRRDRPAAASGCARLGLDERDADRLPQRPRRGVPRARPDVPRPDRLRRADATCRSSRGGRRASPKGRWSTRWCRQSTSCRRCSR